jgi:hypothetical protein
MAKTTSYDPSNKPALFSPLSCGKKKKVLHAEAAGVPCSHAAHVAPPARRVHASTSAFPTRTHCATRLPLLALGWAPASPIVKRSTGRPSADAVAVSRFPGGRAKSGAGACD